MITRGGGIKRTARSEFRNIRKNGIIAINIDEGDVLENVLITGGNDDIYVSTRRGLGIRFNENDARVLSRTARGVKALSFKWEDDYVVGAEVIGENETEGRILTVSEDGTGRKSQYGDYRVQSRGGFGSMNYRTELYGLVAGVEKLYDDEDVILITAAGIIIRLSGAEVRECARPSKGVRLIRLAEGDKVIAVTTAKRAEDAPADAPDETDGAPGTEAPEDPGADGPAEGAPEEPGEE
jgi:DNA gyrase subunit A